MKSLRCMVGIHRYININYSRGTSVDGVHVPANYLKACVRCDKINRYWYIMYTETPAPLDLKEWITERKTEKCIFDKEQKRLIAVAQDKGII